MSIESKISAIVATQIGNIQGSLESSIQDSIREKITKLDKKCPNIDELQNTIDTRNNLLSSVNSLRKRVSSFNRFTRALTNILPILSSLITLQRNLPLPTSTPPGIGVTLGVTNSSAERLINSGRFFNNIQQDLNGVQFLTQSAERSLNNILNIFQELDNKIDNCIEVLSLEERNILRERTQIQTPTASGSTERSLEYRAANGEIYTLEISTEIDKQTGLERRRAVAKNNNGIIILRGDLSFSSDTEVLIEDLKFRLDNII